MNFIEELYYGNLNPSEKRYDRDSQYAKALETFCKNEKILSEMLKITYAEAEFNARVKIYQSINPSFNPNVEFAKDPIYRDIPSVDNSLFAIARKLILESK